jgi:putative ABC transport system ATP-binding protein
MVVSASPGMPPSSIPCLECRGVTQRLSSGSGTLTVLESVDLCVQAREFVAIVGPSGSGKSTLLGLLAGLDRASEGSVLLDGIALGTLDEDALADLRRERVGFVFQDFQLLAGLTARENVLLPLELGRVPQASARCDAMLARVGLSARAAHYPAQLSGGEQQRVALARAFAKSPRILFADEPTGNLDAQTGSAVLELLLELREREGTTLVVVTHDERLAGLADRQVRLESGRIASSESTS